MHNNRILGYGAMTAIALVLPAIAMAQQADGQKADQVEEIVVTARRTSEALQTTPVAVTALSSSGLERAQVNDVPAIQRAAPNLTIASGTPAASGFAIISMRGQANLNAGNASDPAVGIYVDGAYIARPAGALFDLVDMQQVEVLRGPQGTLFGRNTIGGALNMTTAQPNDKLTLMAQATVGNYNNREFTGVANVPLGDDFAIRIAYKYRDRDGYGITKVYNSPVDLLTTVPTTTSANDKRDDHFVRFQARYAPAGSSFEATFSADYNKSHDSGQLTALTGVNPLVFDSPAAPTLAEDLMAAFGHSRANWFTGYATSDTNTNSKYHPLDSVEGYGFNLRINADIGDMKFKSITAWRRLDSIGYVDLDGTPLSVLEPWNRYYSTGLSQELQLSGESGDFSWIGGLFYFDEKGKEQSEAIAFGFIGAPWFANFGDIKNTSYAAYLQGYYKITDKLRFAAGFRYTYDKRKVIIHNVNPLYPTPVCSLDPAALDDGVSCSQTEKANFDYPAWTVGLDYQLTSDIFVFAKTSSAFMAGGFNLRQGSLPAFKPEGVKDVELGVKADWLDKRLRTNVSIFHSWQSDVQRNISTVIGTTSTQFIRNAGDAEVSGLEVETTAIPWSGMEVTANLGLLDAKYKKGSFIDVQTIGGIPGCFGGEAVGTYNCTVDRSGETLPQVPKISYSFGATQSFPLSFGKLSLHADYAYIGAQSFADNTAAAQQPQAVKDAYAIMNALTRIDGYGLLNARGTLTIDQPNIELSIWGRNILGKKYYTRSFSDLYTSLGVAVSFIGEPAVYGVTATVRFGQ